MNGKGGLIIMLIGLIFISLYFYMYGFSMNGPTRWGQYMAIVCVIYLIIDELFKKE